MPGPLWFPTGVAPAEDVDPEVLAREFEGAYAAAGLLPWWAWQESVFGSQSDLATLDMGKFIRFDSRGGGCTLGVHAADHLPTFGDPLLWKVPYNRGFARIGEGSSVSTYDLLITWTAEYPEIIVPILNVQYVRYNYADGAWAPFFSDASVQVRAQVRLRLDGAVIPGSGPWGAPMDGKYRGTGVADQAVPVVGLAPLLVPPGPHTLEAVAAQSCGGGSDESHEHTEAYSGTPPSDYVFIGSRHLYLLGFSRGRVLTP